MCMYMVVIIYMFDPEFAEMLNGYQDLMPGMMAAVGMTGIATSLLEWIKIYLFGFIMMLFPLIFIIIMNHKLLMGYIDSGALANLLATPNSRRKLIVTQMLSTVALTVILIAAVAVVGIASSQAFFPGELDIGRYLILNAGNCLLQLMVCGIAFCSACFFSESKYYYSVGAGLPILFFIIQMMANMGGNLEKLKYFTIYNLLPVQKIVDGESGLWTYEAAMAAAAIVLFAAGAVYFTKRDVNV